MKPGLFFPAGVVLFAIASLVAASARAQTTAPGPYYATPSWDQKLQCDTQATCPRFIVLSNWNNEAVLDRETGLVWERSPSTERFKWTNAQRHCNQLVVDSRVGWHLPTLQEMQSLVDRTTFDPSLPLGHPFFNVQSASYWSATSGAEFANSAWEVVTWDGQSAAVPNGKSGTRFVWCVRGGHGVDPQ
jgi:hypothetical protein